MRRNSKFKWALASVFVAMLGLQGNVASAGGVKTIDLLPATVDFKPGLYVGQVREACLDCHSADYVVYQPAQDRAGWKAVLDKMRDSFHMDPLLPNAEANILDYLVTSYGK